MGELPIEPNLSLGVDARRGRAYTDNERIDISDPRQLRKTLLPTGGFIALDPTTGRYATSDGSGGHTLLVYEANGTLYDSHPLAGAIWAMDADPSTGRFFVTTRDENRVVIYGQDTRAILADRPLNEGVPMHVMKPVFDPATGRVFVNLLLHPNGPDTFEYQALVLDGTQMARLPAAGEVLASSPTTNEIFVANYDEGTSYRRLQIRDSSTFALSARQIDTDAYWVAPAPSRNRLYVTSLWHVVVFNLTTGALLGTMPSLDEDFGRGEIAFDPGADRLYVTGFIFRQKIPTTSVLRIYATGPEICPAAASP